MGSLGSGWRDCGRWSDAQFWRWTPQAGPIPPEAQRLLKLCERPSVDFDTDQALQLIQEQCASLYVAYEDERIVGVLMVNVSQSVKLGQVLEIEACGFRSGEAKARWNFVQALARENQCQKIRAISSRPMHKTFKDLKPREAIFYAEVK